MWKKLIDTIFSTSVLGSTEGLDVVGWKYMPHLIGGLCALVTLYYIMGWELP